MCFFTGEKCIGFTTIGLMESVLGNSMKKDLLMEAKACNVLMIGQHTQ